MLARGLGAQIRFIAMISTNLRLPSDFDDYAWEVEAKGWFDGAVAEFNGIQYEIVFYDPSRLAQDIDKDLEDGGIFYEKNLIVINLVDRHHMEKAVKHLAKTGKYEDMIKMKTA